MAVGRPFNSLPKPVAIGLAAGTGVAVLGFSIFMVPKVCNMLVDMDRYNTVLAAQTADPSGVTDNRQTSPDGSSVPGIGGTEDNYIEQGNGNNEDGTGGTSETVVVTDISEIDNPYASVVNVVYDPDKGQYFYIVERGDTLSEISGEVHVSVDQLVDINSIHNPNLIYTDESLALP